MNSEEYYSDRHPLEEMVDDIIKFGRKKPKSLAAIVTSIAIGAAGLIGWATHSQNETKRAFYEKLESNPLTGKIAYRVEQEIHIINARDLYNKDVAPVKVQSPSTPQYVLLLDQDNMAFVAKYPKDPATELSLKEADSHIQSDAVYKVNTREGKLNCVFSPYSEQAKQFFGDVFQKDESEERRVEEFLNDKKRGTKIVVGNYATVIVSDLGFDNEKDNLYAKINNEWYILDNERIEKLAIVPTMRRATEKSFDGNYCLKDEFLAPLAISDGDFRDYVFEQNAEEPFDWQSN